MAGTVFTSINVTKADREQIKIDRQTGHLHIAVIFPWSKLYKSWWGFTVFAAAFTIFLETYQISFSPGGLANQSKGGTILEYILSAVFLVDILVTFNLAYFDERDKIVYNHRDIARNYTRCMFWVDLIGVFPFYAVALAISGQMGQDTKLSQYLALLRLFKMVRLHRVSLLFSILQYSTNISLIALTLTRNFSAALVWTHLWACIMYFIARHYNFDSGNTWLGSTDDLNEFQRYVTSLYWSVVTFCTVGYGDFYPVNSAEQIFGMLYMLLNVVLMSWMIGSITLLVVKSDEKTGIYRESLRILDKYATLHNFDRKLTKRLRNQLKLDFDNREITDEQVLAFFPVTVRHKILRRLYLPFLLDTSLMKGTRQVFVDTFLSLCTVEVYSPGEELLQRGYVSSDLFLLVDGKVQVANTSDNDKIVDTSDEQSGFGTSVADSDVRAQYIGLTSKVINSGEFINELGFFTESPQIDTIRTTTVCKILTISRSSYKSLAADHPHSAGIVLSNLLSKVATMTFAKQFGDHNNLPKELAVYRAGSTFYGDNDSSRTCDVNEARTEAQTKAAMTAVQDLVKVHINKQKDDHTTRFCFAASRGDIQTISIMCEQNFDPNSADYDQRTALMVAAMSGQLEAVAKLLDFNANPNLTDMHGSSALYEAAKNGHEDIVDLLLKHGALLSFDESLAASTLCQAVFDGDIPMLRRLIRARINVNSFDYDNRTALHIAASEGNFVALKVLVEAGADLSLQDRWGNTVRTEAERAKAGKVLEYLDTL